MACIQGAPDVPDPPDPVVPCDAKIDSARLIADIPKFKPYISPISWNNWEEFLANLENINTVQPQGWILPQLLSASIKASAKRLETEQSVPQVSLDTMNLLGKEVNAPPPVSALLRSFFSILRTNLLLQITAKSTRAQKALCTSKSSSTSSPECDISCGSMVACFVAEYRDEIPQIGKVQQVTESEVVVEWWSGTYTGKWKALTKRVGKRQHSPWHSLA